MAREDKCGGSFKTDDGQTLRCVKDAHGPVHKALSGERFIVAGKGAFTFGGKKPKK